MKGKPVVAYKVGGIPLQIQDGITGHLVDIGDTTQVAQHLSHLLTDESAYERMSQAASERASKDFLTVSNAISWLYLAGQLVKGEKLEGHSAWVKALAQKDFDEVKDPLASPRSARHISSRVPVQCSSFIELLPAHGELSAGFHTQ